MQLGLVGLVTMLGLTTTQAPGRTRLRRLRGDVSRSSARQTIALTCSTLRSASRGARRVPRLESSDEAMVTTGRRIPSPEASAIVLLSPLPSRPPYCPVCRARYANREPEQSLQGRRQGSAIGRQAALQSPAHISWQHKSMQRIGFRRQSRLAADGSALRRQSGPG